MSEPAGVLMGPPGANDRRHPGWPAMLGPLPSLAGPVVLRPVRRRDGPAWRALRIRDEALIARWDATSALTWQERHTTAMWRSQRAILVAAARRGEALPFAITVGGTFAGQVTLGGIQRGALRSGWVGYWVDATLHRRGVATLALALALAQALGPVGLHRVEATIDPENVASRAVVAHLGMREEGLLRRYLDIAGAWRDHLLFAMTVEDLPAGNDVATALLRPYRERRGIG